MEGRAELIYWREKYDPLRHEIKFFGTEHKVLDVLELETGIFDKKGDVYIPTKKVNISPSHFMTGEK